MPCHARTQCSALHVHTTIVLACGLLVGSGTYLYMHALLIFSTFKNCHNRYMACKVGCTYGQVTWCTRSRGLLVNNNTRLPEQGYNGRTHRLVDAMLQSTAFSPFRCIQTFS
jgi:hypothetical protein